MHRKSRFTHHVRPRMIVVLEPFAVIFDGCEMCKLLNAHTDPLRGASGQWVILGHPVMIGINAKLHCGVIDLAHEKCGGTKENSNGQFRVCFRC